MRFKKLIPIYIAASMLFSSLYVSAEEIGDAIMPMNETMEVGSDSIEIEPDIYFEEEILGTSETVDINLYADNSGYGWTFESASGTLTFTGVSASRSWQNYVSDYQTKVKKVVLKDTVKSIDDYAFYKCGALTSISIPDSITLVGYCAFYYCTSLQSVDFGNNLVSVDDWAFAQCNSMTSIDLGESVETVGKYALYACNSLTSVNLGKRVTKIDEQAFCKCSSLKTLILPDTLTYIGDNVFRYSVGIESLIIPKSVKTIGEDVFGDVNICVYENSYAHKYAEENNCKYKLIDVEVSLKKDVSGWTGISSTFVASLDKTVCSDEDTNYNGHSYYWYTAQVVTSAMIYDAPSKLFMTIHYDKNIIIAAYYDEKYNYKGKKLIPMELSEYGGFYESAKYYFILFGQDNPNESDDVEVMRLVKYDKNWNRIAAASVKGCNTYDTFDCNTIDITMIEDVLIARTGHEMYKESSGTHHQSNLTIEFNTSNMTVTSKDGEVSDSNKYGYVSHSFNQFIAYDENDIYLVDHGDGFPRSICLRIMPAMYYKSKIIPTKNTSKFYDLLSFPGGIGFNYTGASLGGMVLTDSKCLVVGSSVLQDSNWDNNKIRNVYLIIFDKAKKTSELKWLTSFKEGETDADNPYIIHTGKNENRILWNVDDVLYHLTVDDNGNVTSSTISKKYAPLSDCKPVLANGNLTWFTIKDGKTRFFTDSLTPDIDPNQNPSPNPNGTPVDSIFTDVVSGKWYVKAVQYVVDNGIMSGTTDTTFEPDKPCTRAMMVTILYSSMGKPAVSGATPFVDLKANWYKTPVLWAYQNNVTKGQTDTTFAPDKNVARQEMAVFLNSFAKHRGNDTSATTDLNKFVDINQLSSWAAPQMQWANANGIINGKGGGKLDPKGNATRAEVAAMIMSFQNKFGK